MVSLLKLRDLFFEVVVFLLTRLLLLLFPLFIVSHLHERSHQIWVESELWEIRAEIPLLFLPVLIVSLLLSVHIHSFIGLVSILLAFVLRFLVVFIDELVISVFLLSIDKLVASIFEVSITLFGVVVVALFLIVLLLLGRRIALVEFLV